MEEPGLAEVVGDVLTWWFGIQFWAKGEPKNPTAHYDDLWRQKWFAKEELTAIVDNHIKDNFQVHVDKAISGEYDHWGKDHYGALAFVVLADQFTRNIYRGTARAWAGDAKSRSSPVSTKPVGRAMLYMPLLHAEDAALQAKSVELFEALYEDAKAKGAGTLSILQRFHAVELFGRFPERNRHLGRQSTTAEAAKL
ncbi:Bacterial protein of unknown function (DUF924) [Acanthamoeba castellanii str. Neff]|uniref:DUF924 domain-containing protein n=1 Tax=Acanthamoeba castellanii (strain ATCC 30010 / Neff) TaxID=1257118 RepID=L8H7C4_ACACF|nr:Bacterial protein of unknown function (DUF924) [Acanthamoeba castellanii str. Neff]ELR21117.1 Bacterial protein of unknown function (DUF924) [Acanthamoeba castellanii str. Neff]